MRKNIGLWKTEEKCERLLLLDEEDVGHLKISFQLNKWEKSAETKKFHEFVIRNMMENI